MSSIPYVAGDAYYRYPAAGDEPAPPDTKLLILTQGGVCVIGSWGEGDVAWAPLPKSNPTKEEQIRALKKSTR